MVDWVINFSSGVAHNIIFRLTTDRVVTVTKLSLLPYLCLQIIQVDYCFH